MQPTWKWSSITDKQTEADFKGLFPKGQRIEVIRPSKPYIVEFGPLEDTNFLEPELVVRYRLMVDHAENSDAT